MPDDTKDSSSAKRKSAQKKRPQLPKGFSLTKVPDQAAKFISGYLRRLKIPVRDYLGSVLPGLGNFPINRIAELTPAAWATRN
jgi:hypothetical protein